MIRAGALDLLLALAEHGDVENAAAVFPLTAKLLLEPIAQSTFLTKHHGAALLFRVLLTNGDGDSATALRLAAASAVIPLGA